jgi:carnitine O-acetyltransferase
MTMESPRSHPAAEPKIKPTSVDGGKTDHVTKKSGGITFAHQDSLPKLPIPDLESTCRKYIDAVAPLQTPKEQEDTRAAVRDFLKSEGPGLQERLQKYASSKTSYIEQFCTFFKKIILGIKLTILLGYDSYLNYDSRK